MVFKFILFFFAIVSSSLNVHASCTNENIYLKKDLFAENMISSVLLFNANHMEGVITDEDHEGTKINTLHDNRTTFYNLFVIPNSEAELVLLYVPQQAVPAYKSVVFYMHKFLETTKEEKKRKGLNEAKIFKIQEKSIKNLPEEQRSFLRGWVHQESFDHPFIIDNVNTILTLSIYYNPRLDINLLIHFSL